MARLVAMPKIVGEMVKPAEKIKSINVNHVTGLGVRVWRRFTGPKSPVSIRHGLDHGDGRPVPDCCKKIGDQMGVSFDESLGKKKSD